MNRKDVLRLLYHPCQPNVSSLLVFILTFLWVVPYLMGMSPPHTHLCLHLWTVSSFWKLANFMMFYHKDAPGRLSPYCFILISNWPAGILGLC